MDIPSGYHIVAFSFTVTGTSRNVVCTFGGSQTGDPTTIPVVQTSWRTALTSAGKPWSTTLLPSGYSLNSIKVLANYSGVLYSYEDVTAVVGGGSANPPPINTSLLINKVTGLAGRKYRGRVFGPPTLLESAVNAVGVIDPASVTSLQTAWDAAWTSIMSTSTDPVLLHTDGSTPTAITSFQLSQRIGTIGRRMRG